MNGIVEKLEELAKKYVDSLKESPIKTVIKTLVVLWVIIQVKKLLK